MDHPVYRQSSAKKKRETARVILDEAFQPLCVAVDRNALMQAHPAVSIFGKSFRHPAAVGFGL